MSRKTLAMKQYDDIKKNYQDAIVFFQLGDFYETFYEDAKIASKVLEITLTSRGMGSDGERIPLAGVPIKAIDAYLRVLVEKGYKVAIVDQLEDARKAQGKIVKRGVTRVITPGTVYESSILDKNTNNFLSSLVINERNSILGFSLVDISTGEFLVTEFKDNVIEQFQDEFTRFAPREIILPDVSKKGSLQTEIENLVELSSRAVIYSPSETIFNYDTAKQTLIEHFEVKSLAGFGCESMVEGIRAAGAIISYISTLKEELPDNISSLHTLDNREFLILDSNSLRNLEIVANAFDGKMTGSLLSIYSDISTNMGARLIRRWLLQPLRDKNAINNRLDVIEELSYNLTTLEGIRNMLLNISDFQRLIAKIQYNAVNARDLIALKTSLKIGTEINSFLEKCKLKNYICRKIMNFDVTDLLIVIDLIEIGIVDSPPATIKEGGIIKPSYHPDLNQYYELKNNQSSILKEIEKREQERTSFNIKLGYNSVHGYYLEVTKAQLRDAGEDSIPPEYIRRQTLVNAERFITPELKDIEEKILNAEEKTQELEYHLFCEIREKIALKV
ncbi:MAG: DNA mismatch repair protein MutS, partial [Candidatus Hodarchaeota archaeon]